MTKKQLQQAPNYTHVIINGKEWIKHGDRLHRGNYYSSTDEYLLIDRLPNNLDLQDA